MLSAATQEPQTTEGPVWKQGAIRALLTASAIGLEADTAVHFITEKVSVDTSCWKMLPAILVWFWFFVLVFFFKVVLEVGYSLP